LEWVFKIMPKKKAQSFNATQIKDGKIVRMNKNGTVKSIIGPYEVKHPKKVK
jgi:hypothetical protein